METKMQTKDKKDTNSITDEGSDSGKNYMYSGKQFLSSLINLYIHFVQIKMKIQSTFMLEIHHHYGAVNIH